MDKYRSRFNGNNSTARARLGLCLGTLFLLGAGWTFAYGPMMGSGRMGGGMMGESTAPAPGSTQGNDSGARLFQQDCSGCHALPSPSAHNADQWPAVIQRMQVYVRQNGGRGLTDQEIQAMLDYLKANSGR